ncbi:hypothetical protein C8R46DRAFT_1216453 [Mycena filopes]|nr:hypothetical protein C8R46DRAFT_1216453 [Mycena filopes]
MATTIPVLPSSPTMSSSSSFDLVSSRSRSSTTTSDIYFDHSDDEIVWNVSEDGFTLERASDDDFVSPSSSPPPSPSQGRPSPRRRRNRRGGSPVAGGFAARPIVDDVSEQPDTASERGDDEPVGITMYDAAASYINSFLADPTSVCRLTLLQSLIVELGLADSSLPPSLTAAKAMLKSHAFLHVGEYLDARQHGPAAVQGVMHKSKTSLIKDLRKKRNTVPRQWVKDAGLQVFLVSCYH